MQLIYLILLLQLLAWTRIFSAGIYSFDMWLSFNNRTVQWTQTSSSSPRPTQKVSSVRAKQQTQHKLLSAELIFLSASCHTSRPQIKGRRPLWQFISVMWSPANTIQLKELWLRHQKLPCRSSWRVHSTGFSRIWQLCFLPWGVCRLFTWKRLSTNILSESGWILLVFKIFTGLLSRTRYRGGRK